MKFTKMQAYGNDYVYIDTINQKIPENLPELAKFVSDRHFGIGSDGMVLICSSEIADFRMRMFNPDGTEGEMCGNALRSLSKYVYDHGLTNKTNLIIETLGGLQKIKLFVQDNKAINIEANIGKPRLDTNQVPVNTSLKEFIEQPVQILDKKFYITAVSWGNPHCVMFIDDVKDLDVEKYGRAIETKTDLFPNKTNVTFAQVINENYIKIREWERGTGETIGCGTGCCTAVTAAVLTGRTKRKVEAEQIGGILEINWDEETGDMYMKGPSHTVFESEIDVSRIEQISEPKREKNFSVKLTEILKDTNYQVLKGSLDITIPDIKYYSKEVNKGDMFIAITGTKVDSHEFIQEAIKRGASTIVVEKDIEIPQEVTVIKVDSTRKALAYFSAAYFGHPAKKLTTIGITGTRGKTSITYMIKSILESAGKKVGVIGTLGAVIGYEKIEMKNTTPESYELQKLFRKMVEEGCSYVVMEVSSQGLKMQRVSGFLFDYGIFTNIEEEHLGEDQHKSFEEYLYYKSLLFQNCKVGIINKDSKYQVNILKGHNCIEKYYGIQTKENVDLKLRSFQRRIEPDFLGLEIELEDNTKINLNIPSNYSISNALAAILLAKELEIKMKFIKQGLEQVSIKGRMELLKIDQKYNMVIDCAHQEKTVFNSICEIKQYVTNGLICINSLEENEKEQSLVKIAEMLVKQADFSIFVKNNCTIEKMKKIEEIIKDKDCQLVDNMNEAVKIAIQKAKEKDIIFILGKENYHYEKEKNNILDDTNSIKKIIEESKNN